MTQPTLSARIGEAAAAIRERCAVQPRVGIVLGTGLGQLAEEIEDAQAVPYGEIPHFLPSTVESHSGRLIFGKLEGEFVIAMQGRLHRYEGYSLQEVTFPVRVMRELGVEVMVVSNASGGMNPLWAPGDL